MSLLSCRIHSILLGFTRTHLEMEEEMGWNWGIRNRLTEPG